MRLIFSLFIIAVIVGCSNDFEILEEQREIPVIYGVIDPAVENQYIRVERVFSQDGVSGLDLAKDPANLYYDNITVKLLKGEQEFVLEEVDGNEEGLPREDGAFATSPNTLYKISTEILDPQEGENISIQVDGVFEDKEVSSEINVIEEPFFLTSSELVFLEGKNTRVSWTPKDGNEIFSVSLFITVTEVDQEGNINPKTVEWIISRNTTEESISIEPIEFYQFMGGAFEVDPDIKRFIGNSQFVVTAGDINVADVVRITGANLGITSSDEIPTFSNIKNGLGIFAAKASNFPPAIPMDGDTKDSLRNGRFTKELNFE